MKKQIGKEKNIVLGAWTLIEHVEEVINHPVDPLPSSIRYQILSMVRQ